jgi:hypothetical protein
MTSMPSLRSELMRIRSSEDVELAPSILNCSSFPMRVCWPEACAKIRTATRHRNRYGRRLAENPIENLEKIILLKYEK